MKNVQELRNELADNFNRLKNGEMDVAEAAQMNSAADKIIKTVMLELKQTELIGSRKPIPFLGYEERDQLAKSSAKQLT